MTNDPDSISFTISNHARMVLNAVATETGPLETCDLFISGYELIEILRKIPNTLQVGNREVDIPRALAGVQSLQSDDPQRIGIESLSVQWHALTVDVTIPRQLLVILLMQVGYILSNQRYGTQVCLTLTRTNWELVSLLNSLRQAK